MLGWLKIPYKGPRVSLSSCKVVIKGVVTSLIGGKRKGMWIGWQVHGKERVALIES